MALLAEQEYPESASFPEDLAVLVGFVRMWRGQKLAAQMLTDAPRTRRWLVEDETGKRCCVVAPGSGAAGTDVSDICEGLLRASMLGIGPKVYEVNRDTGVAVVEYLEGYEACEPATMRDQQLSIKAMDAYRALHRSRLFNRTNTLFQQTDHLLATVANMDIQLPDYAEGLLADYRKAKDAFSASGLDIAPCHNSPRPGNFLVKGNALKMVEYNACANNDTSCELGMFFSEMLYDDDDMLKLLNVYSGYLDVDRIARVRAARVVASLERGLWGVIQSASKESYYDYWKYGMWKFRQAYSYKCQLDWEAVLADI